MVLLIGCEREEIRVYNAPKDEPPHQAMADDNSAPPHATSMKSRPHPQLGWNLPEGWKVIEGNNVSLAGFSVPGPNGKSGEVSIAQLADLSGRDAVLVNMWRDSAGQKPLSEDEAVKQLQPVEFAGEKGNLFEVSGETTNGPLKIVTAMLHHPDGSWFCKLAGEPSVVDANRPQFIQFLKSIQIGATPQMTTQEPVVAATEETAAKFNWRVPGEWKEVPPGQMQVARFSVPGKNNEKADVFVSVFPSDTGGRLLNVNRWRKQIGLPPVTDTDLTSQVSPLDPADSESMLVDMTNNGRRLIGAIVPRDGRYWFYKLLGDDGAVAPEKEAFIAFAKSKP